MPAHARSTCLKCTLVHLRCMLEHVSMCLTYILDMYACGHALRVRLRCWSTRLRCILEHLLKIHAQGACATVTGGRQRMTPGLGRRNCSVAVTPPVSGLLAPSLPPSLPLSPFLSPSLSFLLAGDGDVAPGGPSLRGSRPLPAHTSHCPSAAWPFQSCV